MVAQNQSNTNDASRQQHSTAPEEATLSFLDAFVFDPENMCHIIDDDRLSNVTPINANAFMMGDYSEKGYFPPSLSLIRNEVLECVPSYEVGDDGRSMTDTGAPGRQLDGIAFRCIYCKYAADRAEMAVIRPRNLKAIRGLSIEFQQKHMQKCTLIPNDIRKCHFDFQSLEDLQPPMSEMMIGGQEFLWVSSAIRRGLRDTEHGGILYCPEFAANESVSRGYHKVPHDESKRIEPPQPHDVKVGRGDLAHKHPGNRYWRELMKQAKSDYDAAENSEKSSITRFIVEKVRNQSPPARFLVQNNVTGCWSDIGDKEAMKKTSQALRDLSRVKKAVKDEAVAVFAAAATAIKVEEESGRVKTMKRNAVKATTVSDKPEMGVTQEKSEILNLFTEEIGEWIDTEPIRLPPRKRQKLEKVDTASPYDIVKSAEVDLKILEEMRTSPKPPKKKRSLTKVHGYNGVTMTKRGKKTKTVKYEARFSGYRIGTYLLKADAALAYDAFLRKSNQHMKYPRKINFKEEKDYMDARELELRDTEGFAVDYVDAVEFINSKVKDALSKFKLMSKKC